MHNIHRVDQAFDIYLNQRDMRSMLNAARCLKQHTFNIEWNIGAWLLRGEWRHLTWQHIWYTAFIHSMVQRRVDIPVLSYTHPMSKHAIAVATLIQRLLAPSHISIEDPIELTRFDWFLIGSYFHQHSTPILLFESVVMLRYPWMHGFCDTYSHMGWLKGLHAIEAHIQESSRLAADSYSIDGVIEAVTC